MKSRKSILIISVRADYGGGPEHIFRLLPFIVQHFDVKIACPNDKPYFERFANIVGRENILEIPHRKFSPIAYLKILFLVWQKNISIVHSHGKGAGIYSRLLKFFAFTKVYHTFHGLHTGEYSGTQKSMYLALERFFSFLSELCISVSESERSSIVAEGVCPSSRLVVINNGVSIPESPASFTVGNPKKILHITRFDYAKNSELLPEIAKVLKRENRLKDFIFVVVGDGEGKSATEKLAREYGVQEAFRFEGFRDNLAEYFRSSFAYLSTSRWEGLPLSVLEAKSYGLPPVLTEVTGNRDLVVQGVSGFLFKPESADSAANYLIKLADNQGKWEEISAKTREEVKQKFSLESSASKLVDYYIRGRG